MEVYFKDLISKDASLEQLVDELTRVVHGADDLANALDALPPESRAEVSTRLECLKTKCQRVRAALIARARDTDRAVRASPYCAAGIAAVLGLALGLRLGSRNRI